MLRSTSSRNTTTTPNQGYSSGNSAAPSLYSQYSNPNLSSNAAASSSTSTSEVHPNLGLHKAAASGNVGHVKYALDNGQPASSILEGVLPLHAACASGSIDSVRLLLAYGADVNAPRLKVTAGRSKSGGPSNHQLSGSGTLSSASSSNIALGATSNNLNPSSSFKDVASSAPGTEGSTPLHFAAANGHAALIRLLLEAGARPVVMDKEGVTPQALAAGNDHAECVQLLRSWTDAYGPNGWAALAGSGSNSVGSSSGAFREVDNNFASSSSSGNSGKRRPSIENPIRPQRSFEHITSVAAGVKASLTSRRSNAVSKASSNPNLRVNSLASAGSNAPPVPPMPQKSPKFALFPHNYSSASVQNPPVRSPSPVHSSSDSEHGFSLAATPSTAGSGATSANASLSAVPSVRDPASASSSSESSQHKAGGSATTAGTPTSQLKERDREAKRRPSLPSILEKAAHPAHSLRAALGGGSNNSTASASGHASTSTNPDGHALFEPGRESTTFMERDRDRNHGKMGSNLSAGSGGGGHGSSDTMEELSSELGHSYYYQAGGNGAGVSAGQPPSPVSLQHRVSNKRSLSSILRKATGGGSSSIPNNSVPNVAAPSGSNPSPEGPIAGNLSMSPQRGSRPLSPTAEDDDSDDEETEAFSFIDGRPQQTVRRSSNSTRRTPSMRSMRSMRSDSNVGGLAEMGGAARRPSGELTASALNSMSNDHRSHGLRSASSASALSSQGGSTFTGAWATGAVPAPGSMSDKGINGEVATAARSARRARSTSSEALRDAAKPAYPSAQTLANMDQAMASYRPRKSSSHSTYSATAGGSASPRLSGSKSNSGHDVDSMPGTSPLSSRPTPAATTTSTRVSRRRSLSSASSTSNHLPRNFFKEAARIPLPSAMPAQAPGHRGRAQYGSQSDAKSALLDPEEGLHTARGSYADGMGPAPITAASSLVTVRRGSEGMLRSLSLSDAHDEVTLPDFENNYNYPIPTQDMKRPNLSTNTSFSSTMSHPTSYQQLSGQQSRDALVSPTSRARNLSTTSLASVGASTSPHVSPMLFGGGPQLADDTRNPISRTKRSTSGSVSVTSKPSTSSLRSSDVHSSFGHNSSSSNSHSHQSFANGPSPRTQTARLREASGPIASLSAAEQAQAILRRAGGGEDIGQGTGRPRSAKDDDDVGGEGEGSAGHGGGAGLSLAAQLAAYGDALARERKRAAAAASAAATFSKSSAATISTPGSMGPPLSAPSTSQTRTNRSAGTQGRTRSRTDGSGTEDSRSSAVTSSSRPSIDTVSNGADAPVSTRELGRERTISSRTSDSSLKKLPAPPPPLSSNAHSTRGHQSIGRASYDVPRSSNYTSSSTARSSGTTSARPSTRITSMADSSRLAPEGRERSSSAAASTSSYVAPAPGPSGLGSANAAHARAERWSEDPAGNNHKHTPSLPDLASGENGSGGLPQLPRKNGDFAWDTDWTPSSTLELGLGLRAGSASTRHFVDPIATSAYSQRSDATASEPPATTPKKGKANNMVRSFFGGKKAPGSGTGPTGR